MLVAGGFALIGSVTAIGLTALQALANPSGTLVASVSMIAAAGTIGTGGSAAFALLWLSDNSRK